MIAIVKLVSGEEIIGEINVELGKDIILVTNPIQILYGTTSDGSPDVMMARYVMFAGDNRVAFHGSHVMTFVRARPLMEEYYTHLVQHYAEHEGDIDVQLQQRIEGMNTAVQKQQFYQHILNTMPKDSVMN